MKYSRTKPTKPGWYWCRNAVSDSPSGVWEAVVRVEQADNGELVARWMSGRGSKSDGLTITMSHADWSPHCLWAGPLKPPTT